MSIHFVFSNGEELYQLGKAGNVEGVVNAFEKTCVKRRDNFLGVCLSTKYLLEYACAMLAKKGAFDELTKVCARAEKICADIWDVAALQLIKERQCGLSGIGQKVIEEYEAYKSLACDLLKERLGEPEWTEEVNGAQVIYDKGRLSFIREEVEHVIYYSEDKDFALSYDKGKAKMLQSKKAYN